MKVQNSKSKNKSLKNKLSINTLWRRHTDLKLTQKIFIWFILLIFIFSSGAWAISKWYIYSVRNQPLIFGATFSPYYAQYFGLDPKETMQNMINDLGIDHFRLVSYWDKIENNPGIYNFDDLDWQFRMAEQSGAKISLAIGLRQPRWPECHMPSWASSLQKNQWQPKLEQFIKVTIERYKSSPALESYQLENEYFLRVFGNCPDFSRERLVSEYNLVKNIDKTHPIIISRSNNALGFPIYDPKPDMYGVSVYKRVWDKTLTHRYFEYPFPAWFYGFLGGLSKLTDGREMMIHELQTEAWLPEGKGFAMNDIESIPEQEKSLNAVRLKDRIEYGKSSGIKRIDLWGVEWWYWQKTKANKTDLWQTAKAEIMSTKQ